MTVWIWSGLPAVMLEMVQALSYNREVMIAKNKKKKSVKRNQN